jgi:hypothetical protein
MTIKSQVKLNISKSDYRHLDVEINVHEHHTRLELKLHSVVVNPTNK